MNKNCNEIYTLSDGVKIGNIGNPIVYSPLHGSVIVDENTHLFLLNLSENHDICIDTSDFETQESLQLLLSYGIIIRIDPTLTNNDNYNIAEYEPSIADLVIKKEFFFLTKLLNYIGRCLSNIFNTFFVSVGIIVNVLCTTFWVFIFSMNDVAQIWTSQTIMFLILFFPIFFARLLLHEAGHYASALVCNIQPNAGFGIYYNGPVAYVDLTPLDTESKKSRILADFAGISMDGYLLLILAIISFFVKNDFLYSIDVGIAMACFASWHLSEKSDLYWALRDLMDARSITATWATPKLYIKTLKNNKKGRKFLILLLFAYIIIFTVSFIVFFRWIYSILDVAKEKSISDLLPAIVFLLLFMTVSLYTFIISKRIKKNNKKMIE